MGPLASIFSTADSYKRRIVDALRNPRDYLAQVAGGIQDAARQQEATMNQAFANQLRPFQVTDANALAQATQNMMNGPLGMAPVGMTVWHGSPHKFDKFDASKIGTGEGAQAYGHGLYLAESPDVAKSYKEALSGSSKNKFLLGGEEFSSMGGMPEWLNFHKLAKKEGFSNESAALAYHKLREFKGDLDAASSNLGWMDNATKIHEDAANLLRKTQYKPEGGSLYKVDLPDEQIAKMLDWDKPLSQQSKEVQTSAMNIAGDPMGRLAKTQAAYMPGIKPLDTLTGEEFHRYLSNNDGFLGIQPGAILSGAPGWTNMIVADRLKQQGIPGIRYLDGGSRGAGAGTSNFVVFPGNEHLLQILERNGQPLGLMGIK